MIKSKLPFLCILTFGVIQVQAQDATTASGGDAAGVGGSSAYSVGQVVYTNVGSASGSVNQGVQQPYELLPVGINSHPDINLLMTVYPNPSVSSINLNVGKQNFQNLSFQLFDAQGKLLTDQKIKNVETSIKMDEYNSGSYFLKVIDNNTEVQAFKIIKN